MVDVLSADDRRHAALVALVHQHLRVGQPRERPLTVNLGADGSISVSSGAVMPTRQHHPAKRQGAARPKAAKEKAGPRAAPTPQSATTASTAPAAPPQRPAVPPGLTPAPMQTPTLAADPLQPPATATATAEPAAAPAAATDDAMDMDGAGLSRVKGKRVNDKSVFASPTRAAARPVDEAASPPTVAKQPVKTSRARAILPQLDEPAAAAAPAPAPTATAGWHAWGEAAAARQQEQEQEEEPPPPAPPLATAAGYFERAMAAAPECSARTPASVVPPGGHVSPKGEFFGPSLRSIEAAVAGFEAFVERTADPETGRYAAGMSTPSRAWLKLRDNFRAAIQTTRFNGWPRCYLPAATSEEQAASRTRALLELDWVCGLWLHNRDARSRAEVYYYASIGSRPCALDNEDVAKIMDFVDPATPHGFNDETGEFEVVAADDDDDAL